MNSMSVAWCRMRPPSSSSKILHLRFHLCLLLLLPLLCLGEAANENSSEDAKSARDDAVSADAAEGSPTPNSQEQKELHLPVIGQVASSLRQLDNALQCNDLVEDCSVWAAQGECDNNPGYMHHNCRSSCLMCYQMDSRKTIANLEIALMGLRAYSVYLKMLSAEEKGTLDVEDLEQKILQVGDGIAAVVKAQSYADSIGNPVKYLTRIRDYLKSEVEGLGAEVKKKDTTFTSTAVKDLNVVPPGTNKEALFGLDNGVVMPLVGFGTWMLNGETCYDAVLAALKAGYRHIDTAQGYNNEVEVGRAIKDSGVLRSEIFLVTKLSNYEDMVSGRVALALEKQLRNLGTTYVDLYMLHGPHPQPAKNIEAWKQLETVLKQGYTRAIGLSNFGKGQVEEIMKFGNIKPMYLQNKMSIYHSNGQYSKTNELEFCARHNIVLMAYSTLNSWPHQLAPLADAFVAKIAEAHNKTSAQVLLRWALQMGAGILPRSANEARIKENIDLFDFYLDEHEMLVLNSVGDLIDGPHNRRVGTQLFIPHMTVGDKATEKDPFYDSQENTEDDEEPQDPTKMAALFINKMGKEVQLAWMSPDGTKVPVGVLPEGEESRVATFHGHKFEVSDGDLVLRAITMDRTLGKDQKFLIESVQSSTAAEGAEEVKTSTFKDEKDEEDEKVNTEKDEL